MMAIPSSAPSSSLRIPPPSVRSICRQPRIVPAPYRPMGPPVTTQDHGQSYHQLLIASLLLDRRNADKARRAIGI